MRMTRHTSFGYGKNTDLEHGKHRHNITPSPDNYQIDTFVDTNKSHKRGMSTHIGREKTTPRSYIQLDRIKFPGPGRYDEYRYNETPKWTMRPVTNPERTAHAMQCLTRPLSGSCPVQTNTSSSKSLTGRENTQFQNTAVQGRKCGTLPPHNASTCRLRSPQHENETQHQ